MSGGRRPTTVGGDVAADGEERRQDPVVHVPSRMARWAVPLGSLAVAAAVVAATAPGSAGAASASGTARAAPAVGTTSSVALPHGGKASRTATGQRPLGDRSCELAYGATECFNPRDIRRVYGLSPLLRAGDTGRGQTIVIVDAFGSPTVRSDLATFDAAYRLAAPPSLRIESPVGATTFHRGDPAQAGWGVETSLDVEWAHAMAPGAALVLLTTPVDETEGTAGLGDFLRVERYAIDHHLGHVVSQSWAATENTLETPAGRRLVGSFERLYRRAVRDHVTVLGSAGDTGAQNPSNAAATRFYRTPTVNFPASSPYVTAVGGTTLDGVGATWRAERVWHDAAGGGAGGGGVSRLFAEPAWQRGLSGTDQQLLAGHRGLPDVAWNADARTGIFAYYSGSGPATAGYFLTGGTSEGSPQWAGYVADVDQARGSAIGDLNPILYRLARSDFHDVVTGTNAYGGVAGYAAAPGWDAASGLGTPTGPPLTRALVLARRVS